MILFIFLFHTSLGLINSDFDSPFMKSDFIKIYQDFGKKAKPNGLICSVQIDNKGMMYQLKVNAPINSIEDGKVVYVCDSCSENRGKIITIEYPENLKVSYYHLDTIIVSENQLVKKGEQIGVSGISGRTVVNCLGVRVERNDSIINPSNIIKRE